YEIERLERRKAFGGADYLRLCCIWQQTSLRHIRHGPRRLLPRLTSCGRLHPYHLRIALRRDRQLRGQQALSLVLRSVRPIDHIGDELRSERQRQITAVHVARFLPG